MRRVDDQVVQDFVARRFGELRRTAYLMCGDWDLAETAAETALAKVVATGGRGSVEHLDMVARRALMAAFHHDRRKARRERIYTAPAGHHAGPGAVDDPAVTIPVLAALRQLPPKRQAVVVLSCWQKLGARETADALGISIRAAKGHAQRGITALHDRLRDLMPGPAGPVPDVASPADQAPEDTPHSPGPADPPGPAGPGPSSAPAASASSAPAARADRTAEQGRPADRLRPAGLIPGPAYPVRPRSER